MVVSDFAVTLVDEVSSSLNSSRPEDIRDKSPLPMVDLYLGGDIIRFADVVELRTVFMQSCSSVIR